MQQDALVSRQEVLIHSVEVLKTRGDRHPPVSQTQGFWPDTTPDPWELAAHQSGHDSGQSFLAFIACFDSQISPGSEISPSLQSLQEALTFFVRHVASRHSGTSICYAATENFVVEHGDEVQIVGCVAVLREEYDLRPNYDDRAGNLLRCQNDLIFDFTLITVTNANGSPTDWIQVQGLAENFQHERVCFAL